MNLRLVKDAEKSISMFHSLIWKIVITGKELNYFPYLYKESTNFDKINLFSKIRQSTWSNKKNVLISKP